MPELPEVEIATRHLRAWAQGRRIVRAIVEPTRVIRGQEPAAFAALEGRALQEIERRGKWMLLLFDGGLGLISHLGMTGRWSRRRAGEAAPDYVRARLELDDGQVLDYSDPRLFGRLIAGGQEALRAHASYAGLGPDPLSGIDVERLARVLGATRRSIKEALMDQRTLAGLGNIHVGESLHRSGLHPARPAESLSAQEVALLARRIDESIRFALEAQGGPEPIAYVEEGGDNPFLVYAREGEPCPGCGTEIERIVQGGRSTFFCPNCQPRLSGRPVAQGRGVAAKGAKARGAKAKSAEAAKRAASTKSAAGQKAPQAPRTSRKQTMQQAAKQQPAKQQQPAKPGGQRPRATPAPRRSPRA
jgi:formamidopyrimidine-DNA glycosylase